MREIALKLAQIVASNPQADDRSISTGSSRRAKCAIRIDQDEARLLGLSSQAWPACSTPSISGSPVTQVRDDIYLVDVVARATDEQRVSLDDAAQPAGAAAERAHRAAEPVRDLRLRRRTIPLVWRRDRVPTLTVQADVRPGVLPETVVERAGASRSASCSKTPAADPTASRSAARSRKAPKSQASVIAVVPVMLLIMFTVLMFQLQSFQRLLTGPERRAARADRRRRGAAAVRPAARLRRHPRHPRPDRHDHQERGDPDRPDRSRAGRRARTVWQAAIDASSARFRPIMLTAVSTVLGMIPIAPTVFWGPMAFAIMGGLLVATVLTLVFLPTLYVAWFGRKEAVP